MANDPDVNWGKFAGIGLEVAVGVGLGYFVGAYVDKHAGSGPWGAVIGAMLGLAAGTWLLIKETNKMNRS